MNIKLVFLLTFITFYAKAQHSFSGHVDTNKWHDDVYLSLVDDYRKISGIHSEQIIAKIQADSLGYFSFKGNQLEKSNKIYRIHVDNCANGSQDQNHFDGHCDLAALFRAHRPMEEVQGFHKSH